MWEIRLYTEFVPFMIVCLKYCNSCKSCGASSYACLSSDLFKPGKLQRVAVQPDLNGDTSTFHAYKETLETTHSCVFIRQKK